MRVAAADVDGDGHDDIITGAGPGGGPHVKVFDGTDLSGNTELGSFFAYTPSFTGGVYVAGGDVTGDGEADVVTGEGSGGSTTVRVFDANALSLGNQIRSFTAYSSSSQGVRVAATDTDDADGRADLVTVRGTTSQSEVRIFDGDNAQQVDSFTAYGAYLGGAFAGGTGNQAREDVHYEWDHWNQLTRIEFYDVNGDLKKAVEFDYDVHGRRIKKGVDTDGDGNFDRGEKYVYDSAGKTDPATGVALDDVVLVFDDSGSLKNRILHGPGIDQVFASEDAMGEILWGLPDHQGTIRDVADYDAGSDSTSIANHLVFDAFGNITSEIDPNADFLYSYTGRIYDADAELYYYRGRWYDPVIGRFVSEDPIGFAAGDVNLSRYVSNSPTNATDPSGLAPPPYLNQKIISSYHVRCAVCHGTPDGDFNNIAISGNIYDASSSQRALLNGDFSEIVIVPPSRPEPRPVDPRLRAGAEIGADFIPYVGEAMDLEVLLGEGYAWWERTIGGISLGANVLSAGVLPNAGGFLRNADEFTDIARGADEFDEAVDAARSAPEREVFRALREGEDVKNGLRARSPGANTEVGSHVMGKRQSDLISTTKDQSKAEGLFNSGNGVVGIDLDKVPAEVIDASQGVGRGRVFSRTKCHQEVLIRDTGETNPRFPQKQSGSFRESNNERWSGQENNCRRMLETGRFCVLDS